VLAKNNAPPSKDSGAIQCVIIGSWRRFAKLNLYAEQGLALQIIIATTGWPGDDLDRVLHYVQISLPPPVYRELGDVRKIGKAE
jgi:hypothetical protein